MSNVLRKIDCKKSIDGVWCSDKRIKRSLFGFGARCCVMVDGESCKYQETTPRPSSPPGSQGGCSCAKK